MKGLRVPLAFKLALAIFISATLLLGGLGIYFSSHFSRAVDTHLFSVAQLPGRLMNQQAIPYDTARDELALAKLVGEEVQLAVLCRSNGKIYYSTDRSLEGSSVKSLAIFDRVISDQSVAEGTVFSYVSKQTLTVATSLMSETRPLGTLFLKMATGNAQHQKRRIELGLFGGLFVAVFLITGLGAWLIHKMTVPRLYEVLSCLRAVQAGDLSARVDEDNRRDELSDLTRGVNHMVAQLSQKQKEQRAYEERLRLASQESERANRSKSEFLANMSHEIRTPMNGVLGMAQLLGSTELSEEQTDYVETITSSGESLLDIINDILDLSRIEIGEIELEIGTLDVGQLMDELRGLFVPATRKKGLGLEFERDAKIPRIRTDAGHLRQVLVNLIGNAVKFTREGHVHVGVQCLALRRMECTLEFCVTDTGIGIAPEAQKQIFKKFTQADGSFTREFGGSGLGLSISRNLVEKMGGALTVESTEGLGSTFRFVLTVPIEEAAGADVQVPPDNEPMAPLGLLVLVAEDNRFNQKVVGRMLEKMGCRLDVAENGAEALEQMARKRSADGTSGYDVVLMDVQMPVLDGLQAVARLREEETTVRTPVIAVTAHAMKGDQERFLQQGMDGYISKPLHVHALYDLLAPYAKKA